MANNVTTTNINQSLFPSVVDVSPTEVGPGDAVWILTSAFIIFTMISGFGLVESGKVYLLEVPNFIKWCTYSKFQQNSNATLFSKQKCLAC